MKLTRQRVLACIAALAVGAGFAFVMSTTSRYGAGLSPDSVAYVSAARNALAGRGMVTVNGHPLVAQPPLFPGLLAVVAGLSGMDPVRAVRPMNALLFAAIIGLASAWFIRTLRSPFVAAVGCLLVASSAPLIAVSVMAWSEPLFIVFTLVLIIALRRYVVHPSSAYLIGAAASVALACMTRYMGVACLGIGIGAIFLSPARKPQQRLTAAFWFFWVAALPLGFWLLRNFTLSGTLLGQRSPASTVWIDNASAVFYSVPRWFLPGPPVPALGVLGALVIAGLALARTAARMRSWVPLVPNALDASIVLSLAFTLVYAGWLITSSTMVAYDPIDSRLCSPLYVPLVFLMLWVCDHVMVRGRRQGRLRALPAALGSFLVVVLAIQVRTAVRTERNWVAEGGRGYASASWQRSPLVAFVRSRPPGEPMASNVPGALYFLTGRSALPCPRNHAYNSTALVHGDVAAFAKEVSRNGQLLLVWFDSSGGGDSLYPPHELASWFRLQLIAHLPDGDVYMVGCRPPSVR